jgi:amylosucrase
MQGVDADAATGFGTYERVLASDEAFEVRYSRLVVPGLGFAWYAEP